MRTTTINKRLKKLSIITASSILFCCTVPAFASAENTSQEALETAAEDLFNGVIESMPVSLHYFLSNADSSELYADAPLGSVSQSAEMTADILTRVKEELTGIDYSELTEKQKRVFTQIEYFVNLNLEYVDLPDFYPTLGPMGGVLSAVDTYITEYYITSEADAEDFLKILKDVPRFLTDLRQEVDDQAAAGFKADSYVIDSALENREFSCSVDSNPYLEAFISNLNASSLSEEQIKNYTDQAKEIITNEVVPAFSDYYSYLEELRAAAPDPAGLCTYENGTDYYEVLIRDYTGSSMTPAEMKDYLQEKIECEINALSLIYASNQDAYNASFELTLPDTDANVILEKLRALTLENMPETDLPEYQLSYLPEALQVPNNLAYYMQSPLDNLSRNIVRLNGSELGDDSVTLWMTLAHEAFSGHMYQYQYFMRNSFEYNVEGVIDSIASSEGWAKYCERLSLDWAGVDTDTADAYFINSILTTCLISVVDIGVNYEGWTAADISDYLYDYFGEVDEADCVDFYNTVIGDPCAFLPYTAGYFQLDDLFNSIEDNYTSKKDMYSDFLKMGNLPFDLLEKYLGGDGSI